MDLDEVDRAFVDSMVPTGGIASGFVALVTFMDDSGGHCWKLYHPCDLPVSNIVGLLEMAKLQLIARSHTGITFPEED